VQPPPPPPTLLLLLLYARDEQLICSGVVFVVNIGVTSYGALGHVPPLELGHVKKFGSFYDNNKH